MAARAAGFSPDTRREKEFTGTIEWPTLSNSQTKMRGKVDGDKVTITEYELTRGIGITLPFRYQAQILHGVIVGKGVDEENREGYRGLFYLQVIQKQAKSDAPARTKKKE